MKNNVVMINMASEVDSITKIDHQRQLVYHRTGEQGQWARDKDRKFKVTDFSLVGL